MPISILRTIVSIITVGITLHFPIALANAPEYPSFAVAEHLTLGNEILLTFDKNVPGQKNISLHMPNGADITYGEAIIFGDLYGIVGKPISRGETEAERKNRFINTFNTFATKNDAVSEMTSLTDIVKCELDLINERIKNGESPEAIYKNISNEGGRQLNCATGGGCGTNTWWLYPGRYLTLAKENFDHFGDNALLTYQAGHQAALEQALIAHQTNDRLQLELAYAMNAFASHFLSDRFSAGHIRIPRNELGANVTPEVVGSLLANYMHNEESAYGLRVHNQRNDHWVSYGDWSYFNKLNDSARSIIREALQTSADEIYDAYLYGDITQPDQTINYVPIPDDINPDDHLDISPLFYWDNETKLLMRRIMLFDPYDRHWTSSWWGWSTLAELREKKT